VGKNQRSTEKARTDLMPATMDGWSPWREASIWIVPLLSFFPLLPNSSREEERGAEPNPASISRIPLAGGRSGGSTAGESGGSAAGVGLASSFRVGLGS